MDEEWDDHFVEALNYIPMLEGIMDEFLAADRAGREELFQAHARTESLCTQRNEEAKAEKSVLRQLQHMKIPTGGDKRTEKTKSREAVAI